MADHRGILVPAAVDTVFTFRQVAPSADLASYVARFWIVRWDLRAPYQQETLPNPCVNLVIGTHQPGLFGPLRRRFVADLAGRGHVFGTKFTPAGFRAFHADPIVRLADRSIPVARAVPGGAELERAVEAAATDDACIATVEAFLRGLRPVADPTIDEVNRIVELARVEPGIGRVGDLAERASVPTRTLERLFRDYVGLTPKWVIQRFRIHEAVERVAAGNVVDWSRLVHDLGFYDQAHFIRAFKAQIGRTPAQYAAACNAPASSNHGNAPHTTARRSPRRSRSAA